MANSSAQPTDQAGITLKCLSCSTTFVPRVLGSGLSCAHCGSAIPPSVQLSQLLDHWWEPRRWRADLHRPTVPFLLEKLWTANGQGEALYTGIGPRHANYSVFRHMVTKTIIRGLDEGWMELEFPPDPLAEDPVYKLNFTDTNQFAGAMERLFPEVNWDEHIELPATAQIAQQPSRAARRKKTRRR